MSTSIACPAVERPGVIRKDAPALPDRIMPDSEAQLGDELPGGSHDALAVPEAPGIRDLPPRALHARLLANAAQRRLRGLERKRAERPDDADYWLQAAPVAVRKACTLRQQQRFARLP